MAEPTPNETTPKGEDTPRIPTGDAAPPFQFDAWVKDQPDPVRAALTERETTLKSQISQEREAAKALRTEVQQAASKAEGPLKEQLTGLSAKLEAEATRANFYEAASAAGVSDLKLAHIVAREAGFLTGAGGCDFSALKSAHPTLFKSTAAPSANPGEGSKTPVGGNGKSMNQWIREQLAR